MRVYIQLTQTKSCENRETPETVNRMAMKIRTRQLSFQILFVFLLYAHSPVRANQIVADEIDNLQKIPIESVRKHGIVRTNDASVLKAIGFTKDEGERVHFKATFSPSLCDANATDLNIDAVESSAEPHRFGLEFQPNMNFLISLKNFNFGNASVAYICAKWTNDMDLMHMGADSKFER